MKRSLRSWIWRVPLEQEVDDELAFHAEMRARDLEARGLSAGTRATAPLTCVRQACLDIGRKRDREMRIKQWLSDLHDDVTFSVRHLRTSPGFALVATVTLALGIGATTSIFSVVHAVVLRPLPYADPDRLVAIGEDFHGTGVLNAVSPGNFADWRAHARSFAALGVLQRASFNLSDDGDPERLLGGRATSTWFDALGVSPMLGRTFTAAEDAPGQEGVAVLSHRLWTRRFGAGGDVIGRRIRLNNIVHTIVGVMPKAFDVAPDGEELWVPMAFTAKQLGTHDNHNMNGVARLATGVSIGQANTELRAVLQRMTQAFPNDTQVRGGMVRPLHAAVVGDYRQRLLVLLGAVSLVLLIACGNVANLLLARGGARAGELAVRAAIGAGRGRIVRQLITEACVLAGAGAAVGVAIAWAAVRAFIAMSPGGIPRLEQAGVDAVVLAFAVGAAILSAAVAGLVPALRATAVDLRETLVEGGRTNTGRRDRMRALLVAVEVALSLSLLVGAGLLVRSALFLQRVDPGFDTTGVLTARVTFPAARYQQPAQLGQAFDEIVAGIAASPGVDAVALSSQAPLAPFGNNNGLIAGDRPFDGKTFVNAGLHVITQDYFRTIRVPLKRGRLFTPDDRDQAPKVTILNETAARLLFGAQDPVGQQIGCCELNEGRLKTVVGVIGDTRSLGPAEPARAEFFLPVNQAPADAWTWIGRSMVIVVRGRAGDATALTSVVRDVMRRTDPAVPLFNVRTMDERLQRTVAGARFNTMLMLLLGGVGLALSAIGIYGVLAYLVAERRREIGIRMALGATGSNVVRMVMRQGMQPVLAGIALGLAVAFAASRAMSSLVTGVTTTDPLTFAAVVVLMIGVALIASAVPAWRAVRTDPTVALSRT